MTQTEVSFILWGCGILLGILSFVGIIAVNQLMKMAFDLNQIKVIIGKIDTKHDALKEEHDELKKEVREIRNKIYA